MPLEYAARLAKKSLPDYLLEEDLSTPDLSKWQLHNDMEDPDDVIMLVDNPDFVAFDLGEAYAQRDRILRE